METVTIESLQLEYRTVLDYVTENGYASRPRGFLTFDAGWTTIKITQPMLPQLPVETGRGVNVDIAMIEAIQLISGEARHDLVLKIAPQFEKYTDPNPKVFDTEPYFFGNYGARMNATSWNGNHNCGAGEFHFSWLQCAVHKIKNDRDTRQAVMNIWDNDRDNTFAGMHDYPCTVAIGFRVLRGRLDMHVTMRSNDAWLGLPIDVFQFNQAHWTVANMLGIPLGDYYHTAWSMHIYDDHMEEVSNVYDRTYVSDFVLPRGFNHVHDAVDIINGATTLPRYAPESHAWYARRLDKYLNSDEEKTE